jgi:hypothetical protein
MTSKLYNKLLSKKVDITFIEDTDKGDDETNVGWVTVKINLCSLPIINKKMSSGYTGHDIIERLKIQLGLEADVKVIGYLIEQLGKSKAKLHETYTTEESLLLDKYGIDKSGVYRGIGLTKKKNDDCDYYMSKNVEFSMKGFKSIPSVNEYLKRLAEKKSMTGAVELVSKSYEKHIQMPLEFLTVALKDKQGFLTATKYEMAIVKMSLILTGAWIADFKKNDKGEFVYEEDGHTAEMCISETKQYF